MPGYLPLSQCSAGTDTETGFRVSFYPSGFVCPSHQFVTSYRYVVNGVVETSSGRKVSLPNLKQRLGLETWLVSQAKEEALSLGDEYCGLIFASMDPKHLSVADVDCLNDYLFGEPLDLRNKLEARTYEY